MGELSNIALPNPGANSDASIKCPPSESWLLLGVCFKLTVDTTSATRYPVILVDDGAGTNVAAVVSGYAATAASSGTQTTTFSFAHGMAEWDAASTVYASGGIAVIPIRSGQKVTIHIDGIQSSDYISSAYLIVEQRGIIPDPSPPAGA